MDESLQPINLDTDDFDAKKDVVDTGCHFTTSMNFPPKKGDVFDSEQDALLYYNEYGRVTGFSIRLEYVNRNRKTGEVTSRKFTCNKEGVRNQDKRDHLTKHPREETRTGCLSHMTISRNRKTGKYEVKEFVAEHNHPLHLPQCTHMMPSQKKMSTTQCFEADMVNDSGITLKEAHEFVSRPAGGRANLGYTHLDRKNYLRSKRQSAMKYGEVGDPNLIATNRYRILCPSLVKLCSQAAECEEAFILVANATRELSKKVEEICNRNSNSSNATASDRVEQGSFLKDPLSTNITGLKKKEGRKGGKRLKRWVESQPSNTAKKSQKKNSAKSPASQQHEEPHQASHEHVETLRPQQETVPHQLAHVGATTSDLQQVGVPRQLASIDGDTLHSQQEQEQIQQSVTRLELENYQEDASSKSFTKLLMEDLADGTIKGQEE